MKVGKNVLGTTLESCCFNPKTGFYRDGFCRLDEADKGVHTVCAIMTSEFLNFSLSKGNNLITPLEAFDFPGLKPGDLWCLCANRWKEAYEAGLAPPIKPESTHERTLDIIPIEILRPYFIQ